MSNLFALSAPVPNILLRRAFLQNLARPRVSSTMPLRGPSTHPPTTRPPLRHPHHLARHPFPPPRPHSFTTTTAATAATTTTAALYSPTPSLIHSLRRHTNRTRHCRRAHTRARPPLPHARRARGLPLGRCGLVPLRGPPSARAAAARPPHRRDRWHVRDTRGASGDARTARAEPSYRTAGANAHEAPWGARAHATAAARPAAARPAFAAACRCAAAAHASSQRSST